MCEHGNGRELCLRFFELGVQAGRDEPLAGAVDSMLLNPDTRPENVGASRNYAIHTAQTRSVVMTVQQP